MSAEHGQSVEKDTTCHVCHEATVLVEARWTHAHGDAYCGTGDGSTAYPEFLWQEHEASRATSPEGGRP